MHKLKNNEMVIKLKHLKELFGLVIQFESKLKWIVYEILKLAYNLEVYNLKTIIFGNHSKLQLQIFHENASSQNYEKIQKGFNYLKSKNRDITIENLSFGTLHFIIKIIKFQDIISSKFWYWDKNSTKFILENINSIKNIRNAVNHPGLDIEMSEKQFIIKTKINAETKKGYDSFQNMKKTLFRANKILDDIIKCQKVKTIIDKTQK